MSQTLPFTPARPLFRPLRAMHHCSAISLTRPVHAPTSQAGGKPASGWGRGSSWARVSQALPAAVVNASQNGRSCLAAIAPSAPRWQPSCRRSGGHGASPFESRRHPKLRAVAHAWQPPSCVCLLGSQVSRGCPVTVHTVRASTHKVHGCLEARPIGTPKRPGRLRLGGIWCVHI